MVSEKVPGNTIKAGGPEGLGRAHVTRRQVMQEYLGKVTGKE